MYNEQLILETIDPESEGEKAHGCVSHTHSASVFPKTRASVKKIHFAFSIRSVTPKYFGANWIGGNSVFLAFRKFLV